MLYMRHTQSIIIHATNSFFLYLYITSNTIVPLCKESLDPKIHHHLVSTELSENDTYSVLVSLDPHKATGIDCIGPKSSKTVHHSNIDLYTIYLILLFKSIHSRWNGVLMLLSLYSNLEIERTCLKLPANITVM